MRNTKQCQYCGREFPALGLSLHQRRAHKELVEAKKYWEEEGRRIDAQVHAEVEAKKREIARSEQRRKMSLEIQQLANDIENEWKPLTVCNVCGGTWDNHKEDCIFNTQKKGVFDEILDFATNILTIVSGEHRE